MLKKYLGDGVDLTPLQENGVLKKETKLLEALTSNNLLELNALLKKQLPQ